MLSFLKAIFGIKFVISLSGDPGAGKLCPARRSGALLALSPEGPSGASGGPLSLGSDFPVEVQSNHLVSAAQSSFGVSFGSLHLGSKT